MMNSSNLSAQHGVFCSADPCNDITHTRCRGDHVAKVVVDCRRVRCEARASLAQYLSSSGKKFATHMTPQAHYHNFVAELPLNCCHGSFVVE